MTLSPAGVPEGCSLIDLDEVDSTNAEAMRCVLAGNYGPLWVMAARQSAGRGRSGRQWTSKPGNLYASYASALSCAPAKAGELSLVAGVAAIDAIRLAGGVPGLRLKWPNDILIDRAKVGGILVESSSPMPQAGIVAVVGVGLNLASAPDDLGRAATFLAAHGLNLSPRDALCFLAQTVQDWITIWHGGEGFERVRRAWLARAGEIGEALTINTLQGAVSGSFAGIDEHGALLIRDGEGLVRTFSFGDVTLTKKDSEA